MIDLPDDVSRHLDTITPPVRQRDARTLVELMAKATGETPYLAGTIIGFGRYSYRYETGHSGETAAAGFAARRQATTLYFNDGIASHAEALATLGPHSTGVSCLYLKDLSKVDLDVLEGMVRTSYAAVRAGTWAQRATENSPDYAANSFPGLPPKIGSQAVIALRKAGFHTLEDLAGSSRPALLELPRISQRAVSIIDDSLAAAGLASLTSDPA